MQGSQPRREADAFLLDHPLGSEPQLSTWNGGITQAQMQWLLQQLQQARTASQQVIVACHHPLGKGRCNKQISSAFHHPIGKGGCGKQLIVACYHPIGKGTATMILQLNSGALVVTAACTDQEQLAAPYPVKPVCCLQWLDSPVPACAMLCT